ncbi:uncharacterized protein [Diadema antillarum]|uniref:uncharacterized protein n=1 Tax=Diadema antillarum TaxID=105358 RepID=UPI003A8AEB23
MPRSNKPDGLEMNNLQPKPRGNMSPRSPLTPTIKLSRPPSSLERHSALSFTLVNATEEVDLVNGGFISNDKHSHPLHPNGNGVAKTDSEPANKRSSSSIASPHFPSPVESWTSSGGSVTVNHTNGDVAGHQNRNGAFTVSQRLQPPNNTGKSKRHSLPLPGCVDSTSLYSKSSGSSLSLKDVADVSNGGPHTNGDSSHSVNLLPHSYPSPSKSSVSPWKRLFKRKTSVGSEPSSFSDASWMSGAELDDASDKKPRLQTLVRSITRRVGKLRNNEVAPLSSQNSSLAPPQAAPEANNTLKPTSVRKRLDSFAPSSIGDVADEIHFKNLKIGHFSGLLDRIKSIRFPEYFDPLGGVWIAWLCVVTLAFLYNAIVIFLRGSFVNAYQHPDNLAWWLVFDYLCDFIYLMDMMLFRARLMFFQSGQGITDKRCMLTHYTSSQLFKLDVLSLLPLDFFYLLMRDVQPLLRLPRLLKFNSYLEFSQKFENKSKSAHGIRVFRMVCYLLYMIHLNTCLYYSMLVWEGITYDEERNEDWTYLPADGDPYIRCLFRSAKTLIVIGNLPAPQTNAQIIFMNIDFMAGVFVFASMIGQMRDISAKSGATKDAFRRRMDDTMTLLKVWNIPESVQKRVRMYYIYSWDNGAVLDERDLLQGVPIRMQTDIAINVHMDTLSRVSLFQDCDKMLLRDLVLKLRPVVYLPGEYICRKGAVGKEMYIVKDGSVQVLGGEKNSKVLATLHPGSVFGEISLLSVGAGNRRTADVASPGYANLFVLDKKDLQEVVVNYPDAQESLKKKAREILKQNQASESKMKKRRGKSLIAESILTKDPNSTPTFFNAVLQIARTQRITATILKGSFSISKDEDDTKFVYFSSSDISTDEESEVPIKKRKRPRFIKKRGMLKDALKISRSQGGSSSMEGRSDSDCPESMSVEVHPRPENQPSSPSPGVTPNIPREGGDTGLPLALPILDQALPSPGLSSANEPDEDQEARDSGVDVPLDGSAGALNEEANEAGGMSVAPENMETAWTKATEKIVPVRSEPQIEIIAPQTPDTQEGKEESEERGEAGTTPDQHHPDQPSLPGKGDVWTTPRPKPQEARWELQSDVCRVKIEHSSDEREGASSASARTKKEEEEEEKKMEKEEGDVKAGTKDEIIDMDVEDCEDEDKLEKGMTDCVAFYQSIKLCNIISLMECVLYL